jgi:hypothetical protein
LKTDTVEAYLEANADKWRKVSSGMDSAAWAVYERVEIVKVMSDVSSKE